MQLPQDYSSYRIPYDSHSVARGGTFATDVRWEIAPTRYTLAPMTTDTSFRSKFMIPVTEFQ